MEDLVLAYYLLFKFKKQDEMWIIKIDNDYKYLKNLIRDIKDKEGHHIIVERVVDKSILDKKFKQFQIFYKKSTDIMLYYG